MQFKFQKNDNLELLFKHGNVQFIKVLMSAQYYAKENLAVIVVRIHSDTYNQFKELITTLRAAYKKVDGEWILKPKPAAFVPDAIVYASHAEEKEILVSSAGVEKEIQKLEQNLANDIIDGCLSDDSES